MNTILMNIFHQNSEYKPTIRSMMFNAPTIHAYPFMHAYPSIYSYPFIQIHLYLMLLNSSNTILYNNDKKTKGGLADIAEAKSNQQYECPTSFRDRRQVQPCRVVSAPYQPPLVCRI